MHFISQTATFIHTLDKCLWKNAAQPNRYFATISVLFVTYMGALTNQHISAVRHTLKSLLKVEVHPSMSAAIGMFIVFWGINVAESIACTRNGGVMLLRSLQMLVIMAVAFFFGYLVPVLAQVAVIIMLVMLVLSLLFEWLEKKNQSVNQEKIKED